MTEDINIASALRRRVRRHPDAQAIIASDVALSYDKLWRIVDCFADRMIELGVGPGSRVALESSDKIVSIAALFASALLGAEYVTLDVHLLRHDTLRPTHVLKSPETPGLMDVPYILMDERWSPKFATPSSQDNGPRTGYIDPDAPTWIVQSSGTTGVPKFMQLSQLVVWRRVHAVMREYEAGHTRIAMLFESNSRPFQIRAAAALLCGCVILDGLDITFLRSQGANLICGSPHQIRNWLGPHQLSPRVARVQLSGARLDPDLIRHLLHSFDVVEDVYGSSETIKAHVNVSRRVADDVIRSGEDAGSDVEIVNEDLTLCEAGETGIVRIRNHYMAGGYVGERAASRNSFREGWFYPGDLAFWGPRRTLEVVGRSDDVVNLGGRKIGLAEVDRLLTSVSGVSSAASFVAKAADQTEYLAALVQLDDLAGADNIVRLARKTCLDALGPVAALQQIMVVGEIPLTRDGAPRRIACKQLFQEAMDLAIRRE